MKALGNAQGSEEVLFGFFALKGLNNKLASRLFRPYGARSRCPSLSQAVGPGSHVAAF
jgi:hypothetical protein